MHPQYTCRYCSTTFYDTRSRRDPDRAYCTRACFQAERRKAAPDFWSYADRSGECWIWLRARSQDGYGHKLWNGKRVLAHRLAWMLTYGPIPEGIEVCHACDNPPCIRPSHLFLGAHADNMADSGRKGRMPRGTANHFATIDEEIALEVWSMVQEGHRSIDIARRFNISDGIVYNIRRGLTWKHVTHAPTRGAAPES